MNRQIRIFVSSMWCGLLPERETVERALRRLQGAEFAGMEHFGSRPETPKSVSLDEVSHSDVYVGIFAHRYGSGITEAEYRLAKEYDIPCLIYFKDERAPVSSKFEEKDPRSAARLAALKTEIKKNHTISELLAYPPNFLVAAMEINVLPGHG